MKLCTQLRGIGLGLASIWEQRTDRPFDQSRYLSTGLKSARTDGSMESDERDAGDGRRDAQ